MPLLAFFAVLALAEAQGDLASRAELRFLGLLGAACLAAIGALSWTRPITELTATALIASSWCLAESTLRGSVVTTLLLAALALAARQSFARGPAETFGARTLCYAALAVAWQLLTRPDLLLVPLLDARTLVSVCVLPLLCGLALARLAAVHGERTAWICGLSAGVVAPGFNVAVTMTLVAVAAGCRTDVPLRRRAAALLVVLGAAIVAWPLSLPLVIAAFAGQLASWRGTGVAAASLALFGWLAGSPADAAGGPAIAALASIVLPCGLLGVERTNARRWLLGLLLLAAGAWIGGDPEALAPGLLVLATGLDARWSSVQLRMSAALAVGVGLVAGYPWLHSDPLLLIERPFQAGLAALLVAGSWRALDRSRFASRLPGPIAVGAVAAAALLAAPPPTAVFDAPKVLASASPESLWQLDGPAAARAVVVDSSLVHGALLEAGTAVASVDLLDRHGQVVASATLLAGEHTADWAAGRPDIASLGLVVPEPWARRPSPDRTFFEQRYRAELELAAASGITASGITASGITAVRLRRHSDLPELTQLVVRRLELRP